MYKIQINKTSGEFIGVNADTLPRYSFGYDNDTVILEDEDYRLIYYGKLSDTLEIVVNNILEESHAVST